jgi:cytidylate kinase
MNIIISSWPQAGGTTRATLLSHLINFQFINVGNLQNYVANGMIKHPDAYLIFEAQYGSSWDFIWEKYVNWKIDHTNQLIIDGMITGFFAENRENLFEVMVVAHERARLLRSNRPIVLQARDKMVRERWLKKYQVDIFNLSQIELNYDLILDSTNFDLQSDLEVILEDITTKFGNSAFDIKKIKPRVKQIIDTFHNQGLAYFEQQVHNIPPQIIISEWNNHFKNEVDSLPKEFSEFIQRHV